VADLRGLTAGEKALAIASIAHPKFRENYLKDLHDDPMFTKPVGFALGKKPRGFIPYMGKIRVD
jgi:acyl-CoA hydrolase